MGYNARATISFGYDIPVSVNADWCEADAPEEEGTRIVQTNTKYWKYSPEVIQTPEGGHRLVLATYSVSGNGYSAPLADDAMDFEYDDILALRDLAKLLGWDPGKDATPGWVLTSEFI